MDVLFLLLFVREVTGGISFWLLRGLLAAVVEEESCFKFEEIIGTIVIFFCLKFFFGLWLDVIFLSPRYVSMILVGEVLLYMG